MVSNSTNNIKTNRAATKARKQKWEKKQQYGYFKGQIGEIAHEKAWTWLRKGKFKRETGFLIVAQNNYVEAKIDQTQPNSKCRSCVDKDKD